MTVAPPGRTMCPRKRALASEFPGYHSDLASMRHAWPCPIHGGRTSQWVTAMPDLLLGPPWIIFGQACPEEGCLIGLGSGELKAQVDTLGSLSCLPALLSLPLPSGSVVHMRKWHLRESQDKISQKNTTSYQDDQCYSLHLGRSDKNENTHLSMKRHELVPQLC